MTVRIDRLRIKVPRGAIRLQRAEDLARSVAESVAGVLSEPDAGRRTLSVDAMQVKVSGAKARNCSDAIGAAIRAELEKTMRER